MKEKLFKGKYIIVVYDSEGYIKEVADSPGEIKNYSKGAISSICSRILSGRKHKFVSLIDVTEVHDDAFKDADEDFMKFLKSFPSEMTNIEKSKVLNMNIRTFFRRKAKYGEDYIDKLVERELESLELSL